MKRTLIAIVVLAVLMFAAVALWGRSEIAITIGDEPTPTPEWAAGPLLTKSEAIGLVHTWFLLTNDATGEKVPSLRECGRRAEPVIIDGEKHTHAIILGRDHYRARYIPHTHMWVVEVEGTACAYTVGDRTGKVGPQ